MNNTFDFSRFSKLLALDGRKYLRNFGLTLAILCGLNLVLWLLTLIFGFTMPTLPRWIVIYLAVMLGIILVPAKAFGDINLPREGVRFAMLPVSNLEKYLSYVFFCLLTPAAILLGSWAVDSLLTLMPFGGFTHYIKSFGYAGIMENFMLEISELAEKSLTSDENLDMFLNMFGPGYAISMIIGVIFSSGLFMLGNLLFKTHKTGKTLACMIGISYILSIILRNVLLATGHSFFMNPESIDINMISDFTNSSLMISNIIHILLNIGLYIGLFFKLKTQKY